MILSPFGIRLTRGFLPEDLPKEEFEKYEILEKAGALERKNGMLKLRSQFRAGRIYISSDGTGYVETENTHERDLLVKPEDLGGARHGDEVVVKRIIAGRGRAGARVVLVARRSADTIIAFIDRDEKNDISVLNIKNRIPLKISMPGVDPKLFRKGTVFLVNAEDGKVLEILGHLGDARVDERISLLLYGRSDDKFPKECIEQALSIPSIVTSNETKERTDLRSLPFCTIDPVTAKDFDDAIYFDTENSTLYVAIADVSHYVAHASPIDNEAAHRGFTTYFPHKAFPMLPRELSENICSLKPRVDRLAFVSKIALHPKTLEPLSEEFFEAVIHSRRRFNYDEIDAYLAGDKKPTSEIDTDILSWLIPLYEITKRTRKKRLTKGFDFRSEEIKISIDSMHELISTAIETGTPSHSLVEECMLMANKAAVRGFDDHGGAIYRIHESPEISKLETLVEELATIGIFIDDYDGKDIGEMIRSIQKEAEKSGLANEVDELIIKSLKRASYSSVNIGHFGLGFDKYGHFTSPIRRYSDLLLHRLIKAKMKNDRKRTEYLMRNIEPLCALVSELERNATKAEWDFRDRKFCRWASKHKGERFTAEIVEIDPDENGIAKARIVDTDIDGVVVRLEKNEANLFDRIMIEIEDTDIALATIKAKSVKTLS